MLNIFIFRSALFGLIILFSPIVYNSVRWKMRWLWMITEGKDGFRYLPAVTERRDICTSPLRQPHDRFDPRIYHWRDTDFINLEVPRQGVPLPTMVKLDDLPSEVEFKRLQSIATADNVSPPPKILKKLPCLVGFLLKIFGFQPNVAAEKFKDMEKYQVTRPSMAYKMLRDAQRRRSEEAQLIALKVQAENGSFPELLTEF